LRVAVGEGGLGADPDHQAQRHEPGVVLANLGVEALQRVGRLGRRGELRLQLGIRACGRCGFDALVRLHGRRLRA